MPQQDVDVTSILSATAKYGLPTVVACWLLWVGVTQLVTDVRENRILMQQHMEATQRIEQSINRAEASQGRIERVLRQSCVNVAKDYLQRQSCWSAGN